MMGGMNWGGNWMFSGGLPMLLFWGIVIGLVLLFLWGRSDHSEPSPKVNLTEQARSSPLEILQMRYAQGEINQEEYQEMKTTLQLS